MSSDELFERALYDKPDRGGRSAARQSHRKNLQLCRQVQRALMLALGGECADDLLRDVSIDSVEPLDGAGHLLIRVHIPAETPVADVLARLGERSGKLRAAVAGAICRKRVPILSFALAAPAEGGCDE
jgi:ribosome-binding factor A